MQLAAHHGATLVAMIGVGCNVCALGDAPPVEVPATDCSARFRYTHQAYLLRAASHALPFSSLHAALYAPTASHVKP